MCVARGASGHHWAIILRPGGQPKPRCRGFAAFGAHLCQCGRRAFEEGLSASRRGGGPWRAGVRWPLRLIARGAGRAGEALFPGLSRLSSRLIDSTDINKVVGACVIRDGGQRSVADRSPSYTYRGVCTLRATPVRPPSRARTCRSDLICSGTPSLTCCNPN